MAMQLIINELRQMPDVHGGFFFHRKNGLLYKDVPSLSEDSRLSDIGRQFTKIYAARRLNFPDVQDINLYFAGSALLSRAVDEQFFLVLLCDQHVNSSSVSVSLQLAFEEHRDELTSAAQGPVADDTSEIRVQPLSPQQALEGPLKQPLKEIQRTLVDLMGPMAEFVYEENLEKWMAAGRIGVDQLPEFIDLIAGEMPDAKKATAFKDRCRQLM
jgi:hypothetical protein